MLNFKTHFSKILPALVFSFLLIGCSENDNSETENTKITLYKNAGCQCCSRWAAYMEDNGFDVTEVPTSSLEALKMEYHVPYDVSACHTAVIGNYIVEGHVPVEDVKRLLAEKPDARGIAVGGMPPGSPGMEVIGQEAEAYNVYLFKDDGSRQIYAQH